MVYLARLTPVGRRGMQLDLEHIARVASGGKRGAYDFPWWLIEYHHGVLITNHLRARYSTASVNHHLCALRGVLRACWRLGLMSAEAYHQAAAIENVRGTTEPAGRNVEPGELAALAGTCQADRRPQGARDGALLAVAFTAGLRLAELAHLRVRDYDPETGELKVHNGKGNKQRLCYIPDGAQRAMTDWLDVYIGDLVHLAPAFPMFVAINKAGVIQHYEAMSASAIYQRFVVRAKEAGVRPLSPHDARRTWVGNLLSSGVDVSTIQKLAGHASPVTTARYDRRNESVKREAISKLFWPWGER